MLEDLAREAGAVGFQIHFGKTKGLCNRYAREAGERSELMVNGTVVEVLPEGGTTKYLGRALRLDAHNDAEIENRLNIAWRRFMGLKTELCNRHFPLKQRLQLFGATVSQTLLYGSGTWTLHDWSTRKLRTAQRKMLRSMIACEGRGRRRKKEELYPKKPQGEAEKDEESEEEETEDRDHSLRGDGSAGEQGDEAAEETSSVEGEEGEADDEDEPREEFEPWHEWAQRVTHLALEEMRKAQVEDWADAVRKSIWTLAGHISRRTDGRWSTEMLEWVPEEGARRAGHPHKRWRDDIEAVSAELLQSEDPQEWRLAAANREEWKSMEGCWLENFQNG